ncbi:MAG: GNAT family N-acetyltransferase [Armatimonadetes bacterium]|nr:GNAT family N-acetyltransferase [Armatimonadota bacterium]
MKTVISRLAESAPPDPAALPVEWAEWAEEPGQSMSVEEAGRTLGSLHIVIVGRDEAWLEGLWVQPSARGRGVARRLVEEGERIAQGYGVTIVRTAVPSRDYAAMAVAEGMGFRRLAEASVVLAEIQAGPIDLPYEAQVVPARLSDVAAFVALLEASPTMAAWRRLVPLGWRFRQLVPELIRGLIKDDRVLRSGERVEGVVVFAAHGEAAVVSLLDGPRAHRQALYGAVAERARAEGARRIALFAPDAEVWKGIRGVFVPHPWCPDGLVVVEKRLGRSRTH